MNTPALTNGSSRLDELEQQADAARARLLEVVDTLDARRHALKGEGDHYKLQVPLKVLVTAGAATLGVGALVASMLISKRRQKRTPRPALSSLEGLLQIASVVILSHAVVETGKAGLARLTRGKPANRGRTR